MTEKRVRADPPEQPDEQERAEVPTPHDALFRKILGKPENAASQLRAVLPPALVDRLDLDRLVRCPGSFVDENLRQRHSDLLYRAPLGGRDAFIYVLIEHQSSTDPMMAFRMVRYMVRIWDQYLEDNPNATKLPIVLPVVVHNGKRPWNAPTDLYDLLDRDADQPTQAVGEYLPRSRFLLDDLNVLDEQALRARPLTVSARTTLLVLKAATGKAPVADVLRRSTEDILAIGDRSDGLEILISLVTYISAVGDASKDELRELFTQLGPTAKEAYMTTAEQLRTEGRVEGRTEGRTEGEALLLVRLLTRKFGPLSPALLDRINTATIDQIESWSDRLLTADTLDDVLC